MSILNEILIIVLYFAVRLGVPVALMFGLGWELHRLDIRWQREAEAEGAQALKATVPLAPIAAGEAPCWEQRNCPPATRAKCAAPRNLALPCWLVRRDAEGCLPEACFTCALFQRAKPAALAMAGDD